MSLPRQLPLPPIPENLPPAVQAHLANLYERLRNWVAEMTSHLGNFQDVAVSNDAPAPGALLGFDGQRWTPTGYAPVTLAGAIDGANTTYTAAFPVPVLDEIPQAQLVQLSATGSLMLTLVEGVPLAGQWAFTAPDQITLGTAPAVGDALALSFLVATA